MKKTILNLGLAAFFVVGSVTFIGCGNSHEENETAEHEAMEADEHEHAEYQCPMKCEGDKTYEEAGECPVCGMELKEVE